MSQIFINFKDLWSKLCRDRPWRRCRRLDLAILESQPRNLELLPHPLSSVFAGKVRDEFPSKESTRRAHSSIEVIFKKVSLYYIFIFAIMLIIKMLTSFELIGKCVQTLETTVVREVRGSDIVLK
jgi:hypothetical protein